MKNKFALSQGGMDLFDSLKFIWKKKIIIFLITLVSISIAIGYNYIKTSKTNYLVYSLDVRESNSLDFFKLRSLFYDFYELQPDLYEKFVLNRFVENLLNYDDFIFTLKKTKTVSENFLNLEIQEQDKIINKYTKFLDVVKSENSNGYKINLIWDNEEEAKNILTQTINLVDLNLKETIFNELVNILNKIREDQIISDKQKLEYLKYHRNIAKNHNFKNNQVDSYLDSNSYYLRGYEVIDSEIEFIKKKDNEEYNYLKKRIDAIKNKNFNLVKYNINLLEELPLQKTMSFLFTLIVSISIGLIIGIFYVLTVEEFKVTKITRKK